MADSHGRIATCAGLFLLGQVCIGIGSHAAHGGFAEQAWFGAGGVLDYLIVIKLFPWRELPLPFVDATEKPGAPERKA